MNMYKDIVKPCIITFTLDAIVCTIGFLITLFSINDVGYETFFFGSLYLNIYSNKVTHIEVGLTSEFSAVLIFFLISLTMVYISLNFNWILRKLGR